jgi:hypothetical protein
VWVVIDLTVTSNVAHTDLSYTELRIDGITYGTYELPYPNLTFTSHGAGVPVAGSLVFEVPKSALEGNGLHGATLFFQTTLGVQLDDVAEVTVDLSGLESTRAESIDEPVVLAVP